MYTLNFEVNGKKIRKSAQRIGIKRLIYVYTVGESDRKKQALIR